MKRNYLLLFALAAVCLASGCTGVARQTPPEEVRTFFLAANTARFLGVKQCLSSQALDLSAYDHLLEVQYPPTSQVEVLTAPPARSYQPFAVLTGPEGPHSEALIKKAKEIGADAIILCRPPAGGTPGTGAAKMEAVAIKYRVEKTGAQP
jgi:hypothetical protein